jgi:NAD(P)-dependent dehydrogenase (short-subunit alcohol dehydrogenase family)
MPAIAALRGATSTGIGMRRLNGKIAVITGGSTGMGLATAKRFVNEGAKVVITGRDQAALDAAVQDIGDGADAFRSDISKMADLEALHAFVAGRHGRVDVLFANAGGAKPAAFEDVTEADFDAVMDTNFKGTFFTVQKLLPLMQPGSAIILNTSIMASRGRAAFNVYSASKAAMRSLARSLTAELSSRGIRTNALAPGFIDTDIMRRVGMSEAMIREIREQSRNEVPAGRNGTADDIAKAVLFLASDESGYVSGVELTVDGGWAQI